MLTVLCELPATVHRVDERRTTGGRLGAACDTAGGVFIGTSGGPQSWGTPCTVDLPGGTVERISVAYCTIAHGGRLHSAAVATITPPTLTSACGNDCPC